MGPVNGLEGMIMATGHEGGGIGYGPAMGDIMSDYIIVVKLPMKLHRICTADLRNKEDFGGVKDGQN